MKTSLVQTLVFATAVLTGCAGNNAGDSLSTTYADLVSTSEASPSGDIQTMVTLVSDDTQVATLDWSAADRTITYQPADAQSQTFTTDASLATPTLDVENARAAAIVNDASSATDTEDAAGAPACQVVGAGTDGCMYCCKIPNTNGQGRACTTCG